MDWKLGRLIAAAALAGMQAGCVSIPGAPANPDYGQPPSGQAAKSEVLQFFRANLKDFDSMKDLVIGFPRQECYFRGIANGGGHFCGHKVCVSVNAKNSYGGYAGAAVYVFWFSGDRIAGGVFPNSGACPGYLSPSMTWDEATG